MRCLGQNPGENTHEPAVAVVVLSPSLNSVPLCKQDLDWLLDDADDGEHEEPADLVFL